MIRSMTGFGAAELGTEHGRLSAEIRSVNHRYCEISLRLPRSISGLEGPVRQLLADPGLASRLGRGGHDLIVSRFSLDSMVDGVLGVYRGALRP